MRRPALYSSSNRPAQAADDAHAQSGPAADPASAPSRFPRVSRFANRLAKNQLYLLWSVVGLLALLLAISFSSPLRNPATAAGPPGST